MSILSGEFQDIEGAKQHLVEATRLLPEDPQAWYNLGRVLEQLEDVDGADDAFLKVLDLVPSGQLKEMAEQARSRIAESTFRSKGGFRPDALAYCMGALDLFEGMARHEVQKITFEIAMLGTRGLDVNDPAQKYTLNSLPGSFSGLRLLCIEYVGFQYLDPSVDLGFDLSKEYGEALKLHGNG